MTDAQWLWEYEALREKERDQIDNVMEVFKLARRGLVKILGLDLIQQLWNEESETGDYDEDAFIPMSLLVSRREIIEHFMKEMENKKGIKQAMEDDDFEKLSQAMASGEINDVADMEPVISNEQINAALAWNGPLNQKQLEILGIKVIDKEDLGDTAHISFDDNG
jgi:hypothetical protein